jgi:aryl carrier-like protein
VAGELFIGGDGLAREYFNAPRRTAASFVPHPFARHPGERLYASGDLACWREDGSIAFLGRRDQQVKIRGFRIELGEIESVLASHPGVAQCVVVAHQSAAGEKCLVAYLVSKPGADGLSNASLLTFLEEHLPQYMLPSDLVILETLPLTPNGKVDRRKLSLLSGVPRPREEEYCPPQTPAQELLAGIWADILKAPRVGITDNFFHIGGHSLLAMQVVSRIRELLAVNVPVRQLFETPTIEALAKNIEQEKHQGQSRPFPRLVPGERTAALPLSFAQQRLWFLDHFESHSTYNIPIVLRLNGMLQVEWDSK